MVLLELHRFSDGQPMLVPVLEGLFVVDNGDRRSVIYGPSESAFVCTVRETFEEVRELLGQSVDINRLEKRL